MLNRKPMQRGGWPQRPAKQWTRDELPTPRDVPQRIADTRMRLVEPIPKHTYLRSEPYLRWVAGLDCAHCGRAGRTQAAHSDAGADGKGMSIKADDSMVWPGCADDGGKIGCHTLIGSTGHFRREHAQTLASTYIRQTQARAIAEGKWPKGWPAQEQAA